MRDRVASLENGVYLSIWLVARKRLCYTVVTTDFIDQTSTVDSVHSGFIYAVFKSSFSKQYKM